VAPDSSRGWNEGISAPATLMRLAAGAGREAQERTSIVHEAVNTLLRTLARVRTNRQRVDRLDTAHSMRDGLAVTGRRGLNLPLGKRDAVGLLVRRQRNNVLHQFVEEGLL
jgi:hypothetical protein